MCGVLIKPAYILSTQEEERKALCPAQDSNHEVKPSSPDRADYGSTRCVFCALDVPLSQREA